MPLLVKRTISTEGTAAMTIFASSFSSAQGAPKEVPFLRLKTRRILGPQRSACDQLEAICGKPEQSKRLHLLSERFQHLVICMADDRGPPSAHIVDVPYFSLP